MSDLKTDFVNRVIDLFVHAPDTPDMPRDTDWPIAGAMYDAGIPLQIVESAFHIAFLRRYLTNLERDGHSPQIRSLAYFQAVINSLTKAERDPDYMAFIASSYALKREDPQSYPRRYQERTARLRENLHDRR
jgi:hypothetical protein